MIPTLKPRLRKSIAMTDVDIGQYDIVFISGGWGAAYDLGAVTGPGN